MENIQTSAFFFFFFNLYFFFFFSVWSFPPEESSFWLPLYGNMCCRLVAQPSCMARDMMAGFLNQQVKSLACV